MPALQHRINSQEFLVACAFFAQVQTEGTRAKFQLPRISR
jgi:hypothetical protein